MLIYRLENIDGEGPFNTAVLYEFMDREIHRDAERYPSTWLAFSDYDFDRALGRPHGCKSLRELLYWFPAKVIRQMRKCGFGVAIYEVHGSHVIFGKFQLVFDPSHATRKVFK